MTMYDLLDLYAGQLPDNWEYALSRAIAHPEREWRYGALIRHKRTGLYAMCCAGVVSSVPRRWAQKQIEEEK